MRYIIIIIKANVIIRYCIHFVITMALISDQKHQNQKSDPSTEQFLFIFLENEFSKLKGGQQGMMFYSKAST